MLKQILHDNWTVHAVSNPGEVPANIGHNEVPARVPGCVHTDLMRAGLIEDPYFGLNEPKLTWIGRTDWQYRTTFDADPKLFDQERIDLVCDGLDTVAKIELNGTQVAETINMHRGYRFDVRKALKKGRNELTITFTSPVNYAAAMREKLGHWPSTFYSGWFGYIRKMACNFGWDWGPVVPTSGIWRGVRLEGWSEYRIRRLWLDEQKISEAVAGLHIHLDIERTTQKADPEILLRTIEPDSSRDLADVAHINTDDGGFVAAVNWGRPKLWWPTGHGQQPLYRIQAGLHDAASKEFRDMREIRVGLRTVELDSSPDDIGRKFVIKVNGKPIFCKGFNWIPDDCFLDRACEPVRVRKRIRQALDANANMLRVWGGGIYETDEFYDICDEMGMLVWQDFLFACATYPEIEPIKSEVEAEARYNVARLSHHPSLVLWNGCNENIWGYHIWGDREDPKRRLWKDVLQGKPWGAGYYLELLPKVIKELDPSRPYWAASPWSGDTDVDNGLHPNLSTHGNKHIWEVWHGPGDYNNYRWFSPRFCSEFGYQGPANYATMAKFFAPEELKRGSKTMDLHQKSLGGNDRNDRLLGKDFEIPADNFDDWHYLLQINQARALETGVEWFRSRQPVCMGTLYWQLNDCYPVTSWAAIDSEGRLKPLWYATRRFYAPRLLTIQPEADAHVLYANNDSDEPWKGTVIVRRIDFTGKELATHEVKLDAAPRSNFRAAVLPVSIAMPRDKSREMIVAQAGDVRTTFYFASDKDLVYPPPAPQADLKRDGELWKLKLTSPALLRNVMVNIDRVDPDASIDDNFVTLLPGESCTLTIRSNMQWTAQQLSTPPVFQCANRFGKK
jgi:beta-mannosidase